MPFIPFDSLLHIYPHAFFYDYFTASNLYLFSINFSIITTIFHNITLIFQITWFSYFIFYLLSVLLHLFIAFPYSLIMIVSMCISASKILLLLTLCYCILSLYITVLSCCAFRCRSKQTNMLLYNRYVSHSAIPCVSLALLLWSTFSLHVSYYLVSIFNMWLSFPLFDNVLSNNNRTVFQSHYRTFMHL